MYVKLWTISFIINPVVSDIQFYACGGGRVFE